MKSSKIAQEKSHGSCAAPFVAPASDTFLPTYLLAVSTALSMVALGFAANACLEAEERWDGVGGIAGMTNGTNGERGGVQRFDLFVSRKSVKNRL